MAALPKGFIKNISVTPQNQGVERRQELLDEINNEGPFLPKGIEIEDMDKAVIDFVNDELELVLNGNKVPVFFLTIQRWTELSQTWDFTDKFKDLQLPFISIVRQPDIQEGTNQIGLWNIPGHRTYTYMKVPTFEGGRKGVDTYKIPQPTVVDINYEIRLFCNRMPDLNRFMSKVERKFNARQAYISVNGHPMPLLKEGSSDESPTDDLDNRRFYVNLTELLLQGYIISEDDYQKVPTINRGLITTEVLGDKNIKPTYIKSFVGDSFTYDFVFKCSNVDTVNFTITSEKEVSIITKMINTTNPLFILNGNPVTLPFNVHKGDNVGVKITRDNTLESKFTLIGILNE